LTKISQENTEKVNKALTEIATHINFLENNFKLVFENYYNLSTVFSVYNNMERKLNEALISALISLYNLSLYSHSVEDIEESLIQLRRGILPSNLVTPEDLKSILNKVKMNVSPLYELGISADHLDFYYILPLIKFSLIPNGLMLRLSIPLQTINTNTQFNILKPIASPIPCNELYCQWYGRLSTTETFITLALKDRSWISDRDNINLLGEIDLSTFSCITISGDVLCYTMDPSLKQTVSACTRSLWYWDNSNVKKFCQFELSLKEQYQPIRITEDTWVLHKDIIPNYDIICENFGSKGRTLVDWAEEVTVDTNCYVKTKNFMLYGPLKYRDSRLDLVKSKPPIFLFDKKYSNQNKI
jgi:hypothetical protein